LARSAAKRRDGDLHLGGGVAGTNLRAIGKIERDENCIFAISARIRENIAVPGRKTSVPRGICGVLMVASFT
jgi:hypothetical protein